MITSSCDGGKAAEDLYRSSLDDLREPPEVVEYLRATKRHGHGVVYYAQRVKDTINCWEPTIGGNAYHEPQLVPNCSRVEISLRGTPPDELPENTSFSVISSTSYILEADRRRAVPFGWHKLHIVVFVDWYVMAYTPTGRGGARGGSARDGRGGGTSRGGFGSRGGGDRGGRGGSRGGGRGAPRGGPRGGRGGARGGGRGGARGGQSVIIEPHRHPGVFVARGKEDLLVTKNFRPGESVYGEKRIAVETPAAVGSKLDGADDSAAPTKIEYRVWNPFRSKLAAGILGGLDDIFMKPGSSVLYLGAASGTSVSHVSDIVGPTGTVYAVEFSHRSGRDLITMATHRTNVIPIVEDARYPSRYRMLVGMVDAIFADVAQPDQARIIALNAHHFLKMGGGIIISIKANCIDSTAPAEQVFAKEVEKLRAEMIKPIEQITLEPYERDHCIVIGKYIRAAKST